MTESQIRLGHGFDWAGELVGRGSDGVGDLIGLGFMFDYIGNQPRPGNGPTPSFLNKSVI